MLLSDSERQSYRDFIGRADFDFAQRGVDTCQGGMLSAEADMQKAIAIIAGNGDARVKRQAETTLSEAKERKARHQFLCGLYEQRVTELTRANGNAPEHSAEPTQKPEAKHHSNNRPNANDRASAKRKTDNAILPGNEEMTFREVMGYLDKPKSSVQSLEERGVIKGKRRRGCTTVTFDTLEIIAYKQSLIE